MTPTKKPSSEATAAIGCRTGRLIVLEGMPGAGKTTVADALCADGARVLGEYTTGSGTTVPIDHHPGVDDDSAHQDNWRRKADQATAALRDGITVYVDRDWLSSLAYAYSIADNDRDLLLDERAHWALRHLDRGALLLPDVYVIFQLEIAESLRRRASRLRPRHPWSQPGALQRLQHFYATPCRALAAVNPGLATVLSRPAWERVSGLDHPDRTLRMLRALADRP